jgi:sigma-B regulation protein RsbU (phosphoserine phosphatase)
MRFMDVVGNPRITSIMDLIGAVERAGEPSEVLTALASSLPSASRARACIMVRIGEGGTYRLRRFRTEDGRELSFEGETAPSPQQWSGSILGVLTHTPVPKIVHDLDLRHDRVLPPAARHYRSAMAVPLFLEQSLQEWIIVLDRRRQGLGAGDLEELIVRTSLVGTMASNLEISRHLVEANLAVQREIAQIARIQRALLPATLPSIPGLDLAASYETVGQAGGDIYDFVPLGGSAGTSDDPRWAMLIGDVSGHGPSAAIVMAMLHSILHAFPQRPDGPSQLLQHVNRHLCDKGIAPVFATAFLAFYDPLKRTLTYSRAGQTPPLLATWSPAPRCEYLEGAGDLPLGLSAESVFEQQTVTLVPGQTLVLYTDGITEAVNSQGAMFDVRGLERAVAAAGAAAATEVLERIRRSVERHMLGQRLEDDQTLVVARAAG